MYGLFTYIWVKNGKGKCRQIFPTWTIWDIIQFYISICLLIFGDYFGCPFWTPHFRRKKRTPGETHRRPETAGRDSEQTLHFDSRFFYRGDDLIVTPFRQLNWLVVGFQPKGRNIFGKKWKSSTKMIKMWGGHGRRLKTIWPRKYIMEKISGWFPPIWAMV